MKELQAIAESWAALQRRDEQAVLATVVGVHGSAYRRPGARLLLAPDGTRVGAVSGGCLEGDLARKAWWRTESFAPALIEYDTTADEDSAWGFGLGCRGVIRVLLERLDPTRGNVPLDFVRRCLAERGTGALARVIAVAEDARAQVGDFLTLDAEGEEETDFQNPALAECVHAQAAAVLTFGRSIYYLDETAGQVEVFIEAIRPPLPLLLCGAGPDVLPLVRMAGELGWHVTVLDPRRRAASRDRFLGADVVRLASPEEAATAVLPDGAAVIMTHNYFDDRELLTALLPSPLRYLGILGPRVRTERLLDDLRTAGVTADERLHGPVGLDLGAETPEQIALAIVAEIQAFVAGRTGRSLTQQAGPIHDRSSEVAWRVPRPSFSVHPVCLSGAEI